MKNGKWEVENGKCRNCVGDCKALQGVKIEALRSLSLFFTAGKKEGGPKACLLVGGTRRAFTNVVNP